MKYQQPKISKNNMAYRGYIFSRNFMEESSTACAEFGN